MFAVLAFVSKTLFLALPPALLFGRYVQPQRFSWPVVIVSTALFGWGILGFGDLAEKHERERAERAFCEQQKREAEWRSTPDVQIAVPDYPCAIFDYYEPLSSNSGWLKAIVWFLPWAFAYSLFQIYMRWRNARRGSLPNTSLERTRDG
jgi:hypothetical protein